MNAIHRQHLPPSGVQFSCQLSITPSTSSKPSHTRNPFIPSHHTIITNLIVARSTFLHLFEIRRTSPSDSNSSPDYQFFHVCEHKLHGIVTGLQRVSTLDSAEDGLDRLLVSFKDAKMTLMEWSTSLVDLVPVSLHTFEKLPQITQGDWPEIYDQLEVDPLSRCAILRLPQSTLAVLPFFQDHLDLDDLGPTAGPSKSSSADQRIQTFPYAPSFILDLNQHINNPNSNNKEISTTDNTQRTIRSPIALKFLPGFSEPTLAVLYHSQFTWAGRLENATDTSALVFLTLDLSSNHFTVIFQTDRLPYDAHALVACPKEVGGVLVVCADMLIHIDQSSKIVGISTNGWVRFTTELSVPRQESIDIVPGPVTDDDPVEVQSEPLLARLENSKVVFVRTDRALVFMTDGQVLSLCLHQDGRTLIKLELEKHPVRSVVPSTVTKLDDDCVFVGSMVSDSALLAIEEYDVRAPLPVHDETGEATGSAGTKETEMEIDLEEEDIYGVQDRSVSHATEPINSQQHHANHKASATNHHHFQAATNSTQKGISLRLCDSIRAHGPIRDFTMAPTGPYDDSLEMLGCTGSGDLGGLTLFYREMPLQKRRKLDSTSESMKITQLYCTPRPAPLDTQTSPTELVWVSVQDRTKIFSLTKTDDPMTGNTKETIAFLKTLASPTISASLFFDRCCLLQVTRTHLKLLSHGFEELQVVKPELDGAQIKRATIVEAYVLLEATDGLVLFYEGSAESKTISKVPLPELAKPISAATLISADLPSYSFSPIKSRRVGVAEPVQVDEVDQDGLHGVASQPMETDELDESEKTKDGLKTDDSKKKRTWLVVTDQAGDLHILALPQLTVVFKAKRIDDLPESLRQEEEEESFGGTRAEEVHSASGIEQIYSFFTGATAQRPHLSVELRSGAFAIYELAAAYERPSRIAECSDRQALVLTKVLAHQFEPEGGREMRPVTKEGIFRGVYVSGREPVWIVSTDQGASRLLNGRAGQHVAQTSRGGFVVCESGEKGETTVWEADIPDGLCVDGPVATRMVKSGRPFGRVVYDATMRTVVGASYLETVFANFNEEGHAMWEQEDESLIRPNSFRSSLELILPGTWITIDGHEFQQNEWVTSMKIVELDSKSRRCARREFVGVGTTCNRAEDLAARGGVYVFEVIEIIPESRHPERNRALRLRYHETTKACVTAVDGLNGYFVHTMGQKLYAKCFEQDERLLAVGFLDIRPYTTCLRILKNFIVLGDAVKGITLVAFQEEPYKLVELGHTYIDLKCSTVDLLVMENKLAIVATDLEGTIRIFEYCPTNIESQGGLKLLCRTEFRTASEMQSSMGFGKRLSSKDEPKVIGTLYAGLDGSISSLVPVKEAVFKRLQMVQTRLIRHIPHFAGLNPRGFRTIRNDLVSRAMNRGIVDGAVVEWFEKLRIAKQNEIGGLAGSDRETVLVNLSNLRGVW
ncbi:hypothetical protein CROQUDRAFT_664844 [Cronartium quercuum f. sp. fusiforme G11]|uniref:Cleavage/polyadenylation specificity factor A subunit C-terminal domain-containing protein n=1 Tax=Cronartium quercuum f. sp. fusiforme G11 TaxID=708437 RepID=A0A9P6N6N9_9BASI|nr:hypothetical protein CROQUDRAFT_664844 [Cronartium quercuum f. sp. fusiforme G11]